MYKKIDGSSYNTDKGKSDYLKTYEKLFASLMHQDIALLELGIYQGGSLYMWRDYFEKGVIVGLDIAVPPIADPTGRIRVYPGKQQNKALLDRIAKENAPKGFDIIIDDCSHIGEITKTTFWHLFNKHLKPGGMYVIEDWGTGYWKNWLDGKLYLLGDKQENPSFRTLLSAWIESIMKKIPLFPVGNKPVIAYYKQQFSSHSYGLVGFIKALVDECGAADITRPENKTGLQRQSRFQEIRILPGLAIVIKCGSPL